MKSFDYEAMVHDSDVYCVGCLPDGVTTEQADPIFADSETDSYPVCCKCGEKHDYVSLTDDGMIYEAKQQGIEIFGQTTDDFLNAEKDTWQAESMGEDCANCKECAQELAGWYWWSCQPGCLPDGEANGPFESEAEAASDAIY